MHKFRLNIPKYQQGLLPIISFLLVAYPFGMEFAAKIMFILWLLDPNLKQNFLNALKNRFVQAMLVISAIIIVYGFSLDSMSFSRDIKGFKFLLFPIIAAPYLNEYIVKRALIYYVLGAMFAMAYGLFFYIFFKNSLDFPLSLTVDHGFFAVKILSALVMLIIYAFRYKEYKKIAIFTAFIAFVYIFLNYARIGHLLTLIIVPITFWFMFGNFKKTLILSLSLVVLAGVFFAVSPKLQEVTKNALRDISHTQNKDYIGSWNNRIGDYVVGWEIFKQNPLGVGISNVKKHHDQITQDLKIKKDLIYYLHTDIMQLMATMGVVGIAIWVFVFYFLLYYLPKNIKDRSISNFALIFGLTIFLFSFSNSVLFITNYQLIIFALLLYFAKNVSANFSFDSKSQIFKTILLAIVISLASELEFFINVTLLPMLRDTML